MPTELALDLATLALYDIVLLADDSGSMVSEEGGEHVNDLKLILGRVAEVATLFDDDGEQSVHHCASLCSPLPPLPPLCKLVLRSLNCMYIAGMLALFACPAILCYCCHFRSAQP